jgi:hypothetical protein
VRQQPLIEIDSPWVGGEFQGEVFKTSFFPVVVVSTDEIVPIRSTIPVNIA